MSWTPFAAASSLCAASTISKRLMSISCLRAAAFILLAGPTRIGTMMPAAAASAAPRNELSSHGCTTTVVAGCTCLARLIRRSYLAWVCTTGAAWVFAITKLLRCCCLARAGSRRFPGPFGPPLWRSLGGIVDFHAEQPGNSLQPVLAFGAELSACAQHLAQCGKSLAAQLHVAWEQIRNGGERRLLVDQQHEVLFPQERLELLQRRPRPVVLDAAQPANGRIRAFVDAAAARQADVEQ